MRLIAKLRWQAVRAVDAGGAGEGVQRGIEMIENPQNVNRVFLIKENPFIDEAISVIKSLKFLLRWSFH